MTLRRKRHLASADAQLLRLALAPSRGAGPVQANGASLCGGGLPGRTG